MGPCSAGLAALDAPAAASTLAVTTLTAVALTAALAVPVMAAILALGLVALRAILGCAILALAALVALTILAALPIAVPAMSAAAGAHRRLVARQHDFRAFGQTVAAVGHHRIADRKTAGHLDRVAVATPVVTLRSVTVRSGFSSQTKLPSGPERTAAGGTVTALWTVVTVSRTLTNSLG